MSKTVAYIRVSSTEQNLDRQLEEIKKTRNRGKIYLSR